MEQIQIQQEAAMSWLQSVSQSLLYKALNQVKQGYLLIYYGEESHHFGEASSELHADIRIQDPQVFSHLITRGSIGVAEDYIAGVWSSSNVTNLIRFFVLNMNALDAMESKLGKFGKMLRLDYV